MLFSRCCRCRFQTTGRSFFNLTGPKTSLLPEKGGVYNPRRSASLALRCAYPREWREKRICANAEAPSPSARAPPGPLFLSAATAVLFIIRAALEDRTLRSELPGYAE
jgi:hypothetical protein